LRFSWGDNTTSWIRLEKGIVTGCTISVVLFVMGMNLMIKAAERETRGPKTNSGIRLPSNRGFMDDMTLTTETHIQARWMLRALEDIAKWARMTFKPRKSRCLVVKKGKVTDRFKLHIQDEVIPFLQNNPIKCLGKWFDSALSDRSSHDRLTQQVKEGLKRIEGSELPGKLKAWLYQHGLLPRLVWPLMVYEIPISLVEKLEQSINKHIKRWLGLPPPFTTVGLYGKSNKLQLPFTSLTEEFKVSKARLLLTLRDSKDKSVSDAGIEVRTGRKWSAKRAVTEAESSLKHKDIVGITTTGREGIGVRQHQSWKRADSKEKRKLIQGEIRRTEEEVRAARAVQMPLQGRWTRWSVPERKLSWDELWRYEPLQLSFLLRSVYDLLPTPANLQRWKLTDDAKCQLCECKGTLQHTLSACKTALTQGRYRWRHDQVLRELADVLEKERKKVHPVKKTGPQFIPFVKEGEKKTKVTCSTSLLQESSNWEMRVDLGKKLVFPEIVHTNQRPDIVLWSQSPKRMILVELTVPWEENIDEAYERKMARYQELAETCTNKGWKTWVFPVEIGCRGFPAKSLMKMLGALGIRGRSLRSVTRALGKAAERASSWLWLRRADVEWKPTQTSSA
jgi:hypothetical protein